MEPETMSLHQFVESYFEQPHTTSFQKPTLTDNQGSQVGDWYLVSVPAAIVIYRYSGFSNIEEGYAGEPPVLIIKRKEDRKGTNFAL